MIENARHKACNACRERKIKCDGGQPKCRRCSRNDAVCFYAPPSKRYCKADFASMLETLNQRVLQAEAAAVTAQNAARPLHSPAALAIPSSIWSPMDPSLQTPSSVFGVPDYAALFPPRDDFSLPNLSPTRMDGRGNAIMNTPLNTTFSMPDLGADFSAGTTLLDPEATAHMSGEKDFDYSGNTANYAMPRQSNSPIKFGSMTKDRFIRTMNAGWPNSRQVSQGSSEHEYGVSEASMAPQSPRNDDNGSSTAPQPASSTRDTSQSLASSSTQSSRYSSGEPTEAYDYSSQSLVSASDMTGSKRRRLDSGFGERRQSASPEHDSSGMSNGQQQWVKSRRSSQNPSPKKEVSHLLPCQRLMEETNLNAGDAPRPSPCGSAMRRTIGSGSAFQSLTKLQGIENYQEWVRAIRAAARKEGVWDVIMGTCQRPPPLKPGASAAAQAQHHDDCVYWNNKSELALGGLEGSLSEAIHASVDNIEDPRTMWLKLEQDHKPAEHKMLYCTMQKLGNLSSRNSGSVENLASDMRHLQQRLDSLTKSEKLPHWYFSVRFLLSLGPQFDDFVTNILSSEANFLHEGGQGSFERIVAEASAAEKHLI